MSMINLPAPMATQQAMNTGTGNAALPAGTNLQMGAANPFGSAVGGAGDMSALIKALQAAKTKALLSGKLPGTTPQSLAQGTGMADAGSAVAPPPPIAVGGNPGPMNA